LRHRASGGGSGGDGRRRAVGRPGAAAGRRAGHALRGRPLRGPAGPGPGARARQNVRGAARRHRLVCRRAVALFGHALRLVRRGPGVAARRPGRHGRGRGHRGRHGAAARVAARVRRAVSPRVRVYGARGPRDGKVSGRRGRGGDVEEGDVTVTISEAIRKLVEREDLTEEQAAAAREDIRNGRATPAPIAGFLIVLCTKGETGEELAGCARTLRGLAVLLRPRRLTLMDIVGTGGDAATTFNIYAAAAVVAAAAGAGVAQQGERAVACRCGSAE